MAKYTITLEDTPGGVLVQTEGDSNPIEHSEARLVVLGILMSAKALQSVGRQLAAHNVVPASRKTVH